VLEGDKKGLSSSYRDSYDRVVLSLEYPTTLFLASRLTSLEKTRLAFKVLALRRGRQHAPGRNGIELRTMYSNGK
jgi:hypothetical protein